MSIRIKSCVVIVCDTCGDGFEHDDGTPHFDTVWAAVDYFADWGDDEYGWLMTATQHVCSTCRAKAACALVGHDWSEWLDGDARGLTLSRRVCWRCQFSEVGAPV